VYAGYIAVLPNKTKNIQWLHIFPLILMKASCTFTPCAIAGKIILLLLTLTEIAALIAVYNSLFGTGGASFGSTTGSLSIMAFAINTVVLTKYGQMHCEGTCSKTK